MAFWGGVWFGATSGRASSLVPVVLWASSGFSPVGLSGFFLLTSLGSWRRPVAGLGFGVLLVQLWGCGSAAVYAAPLVVPVPSSFFLRLYLNRPSTERKQFARRCPDAGVGRASLFFP